MRQPHLPPELVPGSFEAVGDDCTGDPGELERLFLAAGVPPCPAAGPVRPGGDVQVLRMLATSPCSRAVAVSRHGAAAGGRSTSIRGRGHGNRGGLFTASRKPLSRNPTSLRSRSTTTISLHVGEAGNRGISSDGVILFVRVNPFFLHTGSCRREQGSATSAGDSARGSELPCLPAALHPGSPPKTSIRAAARPCGLACRATLSADCQGNPFPRPGPGNGPPTGGSRHEQIAHPASHRRSGRPWFGALGG